LVDLDLDALQNKWFNPIGVLEGHQVNSFDPHGLHKQLHVILIDVLNHLERFKRSQFDPVEADLITEREVAIQFTLPELYSALVEYLRLFQASFMADHNLASSVQLGALVAIELFEFRTTHRLLSIK
jgi:hypothetical protein